MLWHLGAKIGEQERKMRQMSEKVGFLEACGGERPTQVLASDLGTPPKKHPGDGVGAPAPKEGVGAPTSSWRLQPGTS